MYELPGDTPERSMRQCSSATSLNSSGSKSQVLSDKEAVTDEGRVIVDTGSKLARTLSLLYPPEVVVDEGDDAPPPYEEKSYGSEPGRAATSQCKLNIVIQIVGSRGDVQPFVALGTVLQRCGHRVRLATHNTFDKFVRESGLEFYPIGGDPHELMAYMVKNPGLIPSMKSLRAGEIERKRMMVLTMLENCWKSCVSPDPVTGMPFVADAIIANPPSFAYIHCAQALGIPVHVMFTMPWTSTVAFPHPLANLRGGDVGEGQGNYLSYLVVEWLTWQGLGDIINRFRKSIDLEEVAMADGPVLAKTLKIPHTYCWSPALVPKPRDWSSHIDICGFFFRDVPQYTPPPDLRDFLAGREMPVYIGFGSIVLEDPAQTFATIMEAVRRTGVRAIISKGWSNLSGGGTRNDDVYFIGDCPHEWLFQHVSAVIHHGGAGTTACGLKYGVPTTIVPFFGDQPFWGNMIAKAGAGPRPIHHKTLNADNLSQAIRFCLTESAKTSAQKLSAAIRAETGVDAAAASFHRHLPPGHFSCELLPDQPAAWTCGHGKKRVRLSKLAAQILISEGQISAKHLNLYETRAHHIEITRWDPISGGSSAVLGTATDMATSITGMVTRPIEELKIERHRALQREAMERDSAGVQGDEKSIVSTSSKGKEKEGAVAGKMAAASAMSIVNIGPIAAQGMLVDIPLAITEGLKNIPGHYNGQVRNHGPVTGAKSGAVVAGKTFAWGFVDGVSDLVMQPYLGARKEGAVGAAKGVGKGVVNLAAKSGAGMFGLFAYNSQGISRSVRAAVHGGTRRAIGKARLAEGESLANIAEVDRQAVVAAYKQRQVKGA